MALLGDNEAIIGAPVEGRRQLTSRKCESPSYTRSSHSSCFA
jgi:hypothetical protein